MSPNELQREEYEYGRHDEFLRFSRHWVVALLDSRQQSMAEEPS